MRVLSVHFYRLAQPIDLEDRAHQDFLRYDRGFVHAPDSQLVAFPKLQGPRGRGAYPAGPTPTMWPSGFGINLSSGLLIRDSRLLQKWEQPCEWVTFHHPRSPSGEDTSKLVRVTLAEVLPARDLSELFCPACGEPVGRLPAPSCHTPNHHNPPR